MDGQKGYLNFIDMINGGGMGRSGDKFEGGGLLSMLGNALGIAPYGAQRERDLEMASKVAAGVALKPEVAQPVIRAEEMSYGGGNALEQISQSGSGMDYTQQSMQPPAPQPPAPQPSYDPRGPMYGDRNAVSDQQLMQFAQSMHPDNRYFFLNSDRDTQVRSYLQAMGY